MTHMVRAPRLGNERVARYDTSQSRLSRGRRAVIMTISYDKNVSGRYRAGHWIKKFYDHPGIDQGWIESSWVKRLVSGKSRELFFSTLLLSCFFSPFPTCFSRASRFSRSWPYSSQPSHQSPCPRVAFVCKCPAPSAL